MTHDCVTINKPIKKAALKTAAFYIRNTLFLLINLPLLSGLLVDDTNLSVQDDAQAGTTILVGNSARCDTLRADKDITIGGDLIADTVVSSSDIFIDGDAHIKSLISAGAHIRICGTLYRRANALAKIVAGCQLPGNGRMTVGSYVENN